MVVIAMNWYRSSIWILWVAWLIYWRASSFNVKSARRQEPCGARVGHALPLIIAAVLLMIGRPERGGWLFRRILPPSLPQYELGVALLVLGLAFSVWARVQLGKNWSATVSVKHDHELIVTGPYRIVRHPIYSGLLLAFIGTATTLDDARGILSVVLVFIAFWQKLRREERWMLETFGEQYHRYRSRTAALVPYLF
jgi:protein-S-isoprenylcysteine O-methyltransferase Ste14